MENTKFSYAIIGGGLSGLHLALAFHENPFFKEKKIVILEPAEKKENDKTWCYWEKGKGKWDHLNAYQWHKGEVISKDNEQIDLAMNGYVYKMVKSIDFYRYAKEKLKTNPNIFWIQEACKKVDQQKHLFKIKTTNKQIEAEYVFDSRLDNKALENNKYPAVSQHFKGWIIETEEATFQEDVFRMMDFRLGHGKDCCFTYVLPFSKTEALVEFTFFNHKLETDESYDELLSEYIKRYLKIDSYTIKETEAGVIPMSSYPFHKANESNYIKIGTAGGWVKSSSGYSFKRTTEKVAQLVYNLIAGRDLKHQLIKTKYLTYDRLFLSVLDRHNDLGNEVFMGMYRKNSAEIIFDFLDEKTNFLQEVGIMNTFNKPLFIKAILKEYL